MSYKKLDLFQCLPRYFGAPPEPRRASERAGALVVNTLNRAFCGFYHSRCEGKPAGSAPCPPTVRPPLVPCTKPGGCCQDAVPNCWNWALDDQCEQNAGFMKVCAPRTYAETAVVEAADGGGRGSDGGGRG